MFYDINGNNLSQVWDINGNSISNHTSGYKNGISYKFSEMNITDNSNIATISNEHIRNDNTTYKITPTVVLPSGGVYDMNNYQCVEFTCNIPTNGENVGLWIYTDRLAKGVYGGSQKHNDMLIMFIQINNTRKQFADATSGATLKSGMNYYYFKNSEIGNTITNIKIYTVKRNPNGKGCIYLDSLEVGFRMNIPHILFNLDCSPNNFYEVGYHLFNQYQLKATLDYHISSTDLDFGAVSDTLKNNDVAIARHNEIIANGFDFGTYSGWKTIEGETRPFYDDEENYSTWLAHANRMFKVNNNIGIYAPSTVHSSAFVSGEVYQKAMVDAGFLIVRTDNIQNKNASFVYLDTENYREVMPWFVWNIWNADDAAIINLKSAIDDCVETGRNLMIGFHQIMPADYVPATNDMNIGYNAVNALLAHVKAYVEQGKLKCSTTAEFVKDVDINTYNDWLVKRNNSQQ